MQFQLLAFAPRNAIIACKRRGAVFNLNNRPPIILTGFANLVVSLPPARHMNLLFLWALLTLLSVSPMNPVSWIRSNQTRWSSESGVPVDDRGYCLEAERNMPLLSPEVIADLRAGDGNEFGSGERAGKIAALYSSSALGVNVFGYWVGRSSLPIASMFGLPSVKPIRFERKFATGVGRWPPNLDVVIESHLQSIVAIESKFEKPFRSSKRVGLQSAYFPDGRHLWDSVGLPGAQRLAEGLRTKNPYKHLDTPQLLKHLLGLGKHGGEWRFVLLWYAPPHREAAVMLDEIDRFTMELGVDAQRFSALSYQEFWRRFEPMLDDQHGEYCNYLRSRYFPPPSA
jgi:hypothetical protein